MHTYPQVNGMGRLRDRFKRSKTRSNKNYLGGKRSIRNGSEIGYKDPLREGCRRNRHNLMDTNHMTRVSYWFETTHLCTIVTFMRRIGLLYSSSVVLFRDPQAIHNSIKIGYPVQSWIIASCKTKSQGGLGMSH